MDTARLSVEGLSAPANRTFGGVGTLGPWGLGALGSACRSKPADHGQAMDRRSSARGRNVSLSKKSPAPCVGDGGSRRWGITVPPFVCKRRRAFESTRRRYARLRLRAWPVTNATRRDKLIRRECSFERSRAATLIDNVTSASPRSSGRARSLNKGARTPLQSGEKQQAKHRLLAAPEETQMHNIGALPRTYCVRVLY